MKKLMFAVAALAAGVACAEITSANVVGYQSIEIPNVDFVLFTPTFTGLTSGLDLTDISMCDAEGEELDPFNAVSIQVMDETGAYTDAYAYSPILGEGWNVDGTPVEKGTVVIPVGRAFCVANSYGDSVYMRVAGQVDRVNKNEIPNIDYVLWGNSTPISIDLTDVTIVDEEGEEIDPFNAISIQFMDETGAYTDAYAYSPVLGEGWNADGEPVTAGQIVIKPGESFCVANSYGEKVFIKLPDPINYNLPSAE